MRRRCPRFKPGKFQPVVAADIVDWFCEKHEINIIARSASACGAAYKKTRSIKIPYPNTAENFMVSLHEIGHLVKSGAPKLYLREYKAEMFAIQTARQLGLPEHDILRYEGRAKGYVLMTLAKGFCRGLNLESIRPDVMAWLKLDLSDWHGHSIFVERKVKGVCIIRYTKERKVIKQATVNFIENSQLCP